jgi:hypothetical protein
VLIATVAAVVFVLLVLGLTIFCATSDRHRRSGSGFTSDAAAGGDRLAVGVMHVFDRGGCVGDSRDKVIRSPSSASRKR